MLILAKKISEIILKKLKKEEAQKFVKNLKLFDDIIIHQKKLSLAINSPRIGFLEKKDLISKVIKASDIKIGEIGINLLVILIRLNKISVIKDIINEIEDSLLKKENITKVRLIVTEGMNNLEIEIIEKFLVEKYALSPKFKIDKKDQLIGGFRAFFDGKMLDLSMLSFFEKLESIKIQ